MILMRNVAASKRIRSCKVDSGGKLIVNVSAFVN